MGQRAGPGIARSNRVVTASITRKPQILRGKRAVSQEGGGGKRRAKSFGGRRVSFAPDDELETMHLFVVRTRARSVGSAASRQQHGWPRAQGQGAHRAWARTPQL